MPVSEARFRHVLGHLAGGVAVVTSLGPDGGPRGLTATAVCSVSLDPPLVLASLARTSHTHEGVRQSGVFALNLLAGDQEALAVRFAREDPRKFEGLEVDTAATGAPLLAEALAFVDCTVEREIPAGDHTLFLGRAEAAAVRRDGGEPLVYHLGRYGKLEGPSETPDDAC